MTFLKYTNNDMFVWLHLLLFEQEKVRIIDVFPNCLVFESFENLKKAVALGRRIKAIVNI